MRIRSVLAGIALVAALGTHASESRQATLDIKGMDCAACPVTVKVVLTRQPGVADVKVDAKQSTAVVTFDPAKVSADRLAKVVTETGYPATLRR